MIDYAIEDLVPFSAEVWRRLVATHNQALWPAQIATMTSGVAALSLVWRGLARPALVLLAVGWLVVGLSFHIGHLSTLLWAAAWFGGLFVAQGALTGVAATRTRPPRRSWVGAGVVVAGLAWPLGAWAAGRPFAEAQWFGIGPDPTAVVSVGLLWLARAPWPLLILPIGWCVVAGALAWVLA